MAELIIYQNDNLNKNIIYDDVAVDKAKTEYQKLVSLLNTQNKDFFLNFSQ